MHVNSRERGINWAEMCFAISGTGEVRYVHTYFVDTVRANDRRKDVPAVLISRLNQLIRRNAANDAK